MLQEDTNYVLGMHPHISVLILHWKATERLLCNCHVAGMRLVLSLRPCFMQIPTQAVAHTLWPQPISAAWPQRGPPRPPPCLCPHPRLPMGTPQPPPTALPQSVTTSQSMLSERQCIHPDRDLVHIQHAQPWACLQIFWESLQFFLGENRDRHSCVKQSAIDV